MVSKVSLDVLVLLEQRDSLLAALENLLDACELGWVVGQDDPVLQSAREACRRRWEVSDA